MFDPMMAWARHGFVRAYRGLKKRQRRRHVKSELNRWNARYATAIARGRARTNAQLDVLDLDAAQIRTIEEEARRQGVAVIATVDQDGYWKSAVGPIPGLATVTDHDFLPRSRPLEIVWTPDYFGVRKRYRGNYFAFLNELSILDRLGGLGMRVPAILDVASDEPDLVISYIPGRVVRDELVQAGALVRNRDRMRGWTHRENVLRTLDLGRRALPTVLPQAFIDELARDLGRFHEVGVMMPDINWGNIIIGRDGHPWWLDFHVAEDHSELSRENFQVLADLDVERFNLAFATALPQLTPAPSFRHLRRLFAR